MFVDPLGLWESSDEQLSHRAQLYIKYYTKCWNEANEAYQNAQTDEEREEAQRSMDFYHSMADDIRCLDSKELVTGTIYDVPLFKQGKWNLCWAYSQVMIENFQSGGEMRQEQADVRAKEISESINGTGQNSDGTFVWDKGGWPTNSQDVTNNNKAHIQEVGSFNDLSTFIANDPVYAYFSNQLEDVAHMIVVTGVASAPGHSNLVASNDPKGYANIQTYDDFNKGILSAASKSVMTFRGILRP